MRSVITATEQVQVKDSAGAVINPSRREDTEAVRDRLPAGGAAAEETLAAVRDRLPAGGAATEATLAAVAGYLDTVEALLARLPVGGAASEATLATLATEAKLEAVRAAVDELEALARPPTTTSAGSGATPANGSWGAITTAGTKRAVFLRSRSARGVDVSLDGGVTRWATLYLDEVLLLSWAGTLHVRSRDGNAAAENYEGGWLTA